MDKHNRKTTPIASILEDPNKLVNYSENLVTKLWRTILYDLDFGGKKFYNCVSRYLHDPKSGIKDDANARNNHRGNLMKELGGKSMSWGNFMKGLQVLGVEEFELAITIKRRNIITKHIVSAVNEVTYPEDNENLSRARVVDGFESKAGESSVTITPTNEHQPANRFTLPEGLKRKS